MKWPQADVDFLHERYGTLTAREIGHCLNRRREAVKDKARRLGLRSDARKMFDRSPACGVRKYSIDQSYFHEPNVANSYWAGFIAADGCVGSRDRALIIMLDRKYSLAKQAMSFYGGLG